MKKKKAKNNIIDDKKQELVITRMFNAPQLNVWKAWTEPEELKKWWGPKDFTCPAANIDFRVGGKYHVAMHGPRGSKFDIDLWSTGIYKEIVPMERVVMTDSFADEKGNVVSSAHYGMGQDFPKEMIITILLERKNNKTKLTVKHSDISKMNPTDRRNMDQGWSQSLDKLENYLSNT